MQKTVGAGINSERKPSKPSVIKLNVPDPLGSRV